MLIHGNYKMAKLIKGSGVELEETVEGGIETKVERATVQKTQPFVEVSPHPQYQAVLSLFEMKYGGLRHEQQIEVIEKILQQTGKNAYLFDEEQSQNLGYLTTLYANLKFTNEQGIVELEDLEFLTPWGLNTIPYLLAGLANARIGEFWHTGDFGLLHSSNVELEKVMTPNHFGCFSENLSIGTVVSCGYKFGDASKNMKIELVNSAGTDFGEESQSMQIGVVERPGARFAIRSHDLYVEKVTGPLSSFGFNSEDFSVKFLETINTSAFLSQSTGATIYSCNSEVLGLTYETASGYVVQSQDGKIKTDIGSDALERLSHKFDVESVRDAMDLLNVKVTTNDDMPTMEDDDCPF
jgi:hypothetical protein